STPFRPHRPCRSVPFRPDPSFPSASAPLRSVLGLWSDLKGPDSDLGRCPVGWDQHQPIEYEVCGLIRVADTAFIAS
ncbi:hypothetical protein COCCADRAFT_112750, partial [Bipolaris zeicola 26-R-13]